MNSVGNWPKCPSPSHSLGNFQCSLPWPLGTLPSALTASAIPLVRLLQHAVLMPAFSQQTVCSTTPQAHIQKAAYRLPEGLPVIPQDFSHQPPGSPQVLKDGGGGFPFPLSHPLTFQELLFLPFSIKAHRKQWLRACTAGNIFTISTQTLKEPIPGGKAQLGVFKQRQQDQHCTF